VDSGFGNSICWTLPIVATIIHFTTLQHINKRLYLLNSVFHTALPGRRVFTSVFLAPCRTLDSGTLLSLSVCICLKPESEFYITIDGQSPSLSWNKAPIWRLRADFYSLRQLRVCWCGALSLTRGRVCRLRFLLALASPVILGSQSLGTSDNILLSQIRDFPFRRLVRLAGLRWRYSTPPPHGQSAIPLRQSFANWIGNTLLNSWALVQTTLRWCGNRSSPSRWVAKTATSYCHANS
jgi:hypothetical protein